VHPSPKVASEPAPIPALVVAAAGKVSHRHRYIFFTEGGEPFQTVYLPYNRWRQVMETFAVRYHKPYNARHTYISWRLMKGDSPTARGAG
jgi:hypothetical protein